MNKILLALLLFSSTAIAQLATTDSGRAPGETLKTTKTGSVHVPHVALSDGTTVLSETNPLSTNPVTEHNLDLARGLITGQSIVHKFGGNPSIAASSTEDINFTGTINWLTVADEVRVKAGGNAADAAAGNGARKVIVVGLDETWAGASEEITMNADGTAASATTTITFIRVYRAYVTDVGVYGVANTGNIVIETEAGTSLITIAATAGQTETSQYTIPLGKTGYLRRLATDVDSGKAATVTMWQRQDADDISAPFTGRRLIYDFPSLIGESEINFESYRAFPAITDLWWSASTGSGNATTVEIDFDLILVTN